MKNEAKTLRENIRLLEQQLESLNSSECTFCQISSTQCHIITELGRNGYHSLKELAATINLDTSTVSRAVETLVTSGHLQRTPGQKDRRSIIISLSEKGKEIFDQIEQNMDQYFNQIYLLLPLEKRSAIIENISILNTALSTSRK